MYNWLLSFINILNKIFWNVIGYMDYQTSWIGQNNLGLKLLYELNFVSLYVFTDLVNIDYHTFIIN